MDGTRNTDTRVHHTRTIRAGRLSCEIFTGEVYPAEPLSTPLDDNTPNLKVKRKVIKTEDFTKKIDR